MNIDNIEPANTYEALKVQFNALKRLCQCQQSEVNVYRKRIKEFRVERIIDAGQNSLVETDPNAPDPYYNQTFKTESDE